MRLKIFFVPNIMFISRATNMMPVVKKKICKPWKGATK
jgi:hypothetical protein